MNNNTTDDAPRWYAIRTHPRQETRAEENLKAWNVETFAPRIRERHYSYGTYVPKIKHLFPRYIFARFKGHEMFHKVSFTRGVEYIVGFGGQLTPVEDEIIEVIRMRVADDGFIHLGEQFRTGDRVVIKEGPLKNFVGIFEREVKQEDRVMILLTAMSYQNHVVLDRDIVSNARTAGQNA